MDTHLTMTYETQYLTRWNKVYGSKMTRMVNVIKTYHDWDNLDTHILCTEMDKVQNRCTAYESHDLFTRPICQLSEQDKEDVLGLFYSLDELFSDMAEYVNDNFDVLMKHIDAL